MTVILMSGDLVRRRRENMRWQLGKLVRDQESPVTGQVWEGPPQWTLAPGALPCLLHRLGWSDWSHSKVRNCEQWAPAAARWLGSSPRQGWASRPPWPTGRLMSSPPPSRGSATSSLPLPTTNRSHKSAIGSLIKNRYVDEIKTKQVYWNRSPTFWLVFLNRTLWPGNESLTIKSVWQICSRMDLTRTPRTTTWCLAAITTTSGTPGMLQPPTSHSSSSWAPSSSFSYSPQSSHAPKKGNNHR